MLPMNAPRREHHARCSANREIIDILKTSEIRKPLNPREQVLHLRSDSHIRKAVLHHSRSFPGTLEMLTLLEPFDTETFYHCIRTHRSSNGNLKARIRSAL
jgi:hypothetical protein